MSTHRNPIAPLEEIALEVHNALTSYWLYKRLSNRLTTENLSGLDNLELILLIQSLFQDLVLRLCKLGDKRKDVWGFQQTRKYVEKHGDHAKISPHAKKEIERYDKLIETIKDYHRDTYIAHNAQLKPWHSAPVANIREIIGAAVNVCDLLHDESVEHKIEWAGKVIDLRDNI